MTMTESVRRTTRTTEQVKAERAQLRKERLCRHYTTKRVGNTQQCVDCGRGGLGLQYDPNPWAGKVVCPKCGSVLFTLPVDPLDPNTNWRCVACHIYAAGPLAEA